LSEHFEDRPPTIRAGESRLFLVNFHHRLVYR